ncbi:MAG: LuxR family transcriptional regulator [Hyphomonadaceae bacterium]|nr:LuxR family transcriptional regulator [Hyphomonadaceae bacterium]
MSVAERLWTFVESCESQTTVGGLSESFLDQMSTLGFPFVALASHVDPLNPPPGAVMVLRYPNTWVEHYSAQQYQRFDPVFEVAKRRVTPFRWSEGRFQAKLSGMQLHVLAEGREAGIADGVTIPIRGPDALPASCSLVPDATGVDPEHYKLAHAMAVYAHERARRIFAESVVAACRPLTKRERECLVLVARGKSDWAISSILGVSESAVNRVIERAKKRLGVATRTQAIVRALHTGEISLYEITD